MMFPFILYYLAFIFKSLIKTQFGIEKLVGKVSINILCHAKSAVCIISIIINAPAVVKGLLWYKGPHLSAMHTYQAFISTSSRYISVQINEVLSCNKK